jgi:protein-arginine kinase activator protein McsA
MSCLNNKKMTKHSKLKKCKLCRAKIPKGKESYLEGNIVCQTCYKRLKTPIAPLRRNSWMDKLIEEVKLRKGL